MNMKMNKHISDTEIKKQFHFNSRKAVFTNKHAVTKVYIYYRWNL